MRLQVAFLLSVGLFATAKAVPCNCGLGPGERICGPGRLQAPDIFDDEVGLIAGRRHPLVIRPEPYISPILKEKLEIKSAAQGASEILSDVVRSGIITPGKKSKINLCSCGHTFVTPAHVPQPPCSKCGAKDLALSAVLKGGAAAAEEITNAGGCSSSVASALVKGLESNSYSYNQDKLYRVPADAVSLALALKQQLRNQHIPRNSAADRDIAFGFQKLPIEIAAERKLAHEGNLNTINGQILELKLPKASVTKTVDEEAFEELLTQPEEEAETYGRQVKTPSLAEIGFINAEAPKQKFISLDVGASKQPANIIEDLAPCLDGFAPGQVLLKQSERVPELSLNEQTLYVGNEGYKAQRVWSNSANTIFKRVGYGCGC